MAEPIDVYSDQFLVTISPWAANLSFLVSEAHPEQARPSPPTRVATVRMSVEHLKTMAVIIVRHVKKAEAQLGISYDVPKQVLAQLGIAPEDWDRFWAKEL